MSTFQAQGNALHGMDRLPSGEAPEEPLRERIALDQHSSITITDAGGFISYANENFCALSQYSALELLGQNHRILKSGLHSDEFFAEMYRAITTDKVWRGEMANRAKDGSIFWADTTIVPFRRGQEEPHQYVALRSDITRLKRAEQELKEAHALRDVTLSQLAAQEEAVKDLADQLFALHQHAIVAMTDVRGRITYVNEKFCEISKYSKEELVGQDHRVLNSHYHPKEFFRQLYSVITRGGVWHGEIKNRAKDGSFYWVDTTIVPTLSADGKPRRYVAIRTDITERKRGEEVQETLASLVESSHDAIIGKGLDGTIKSWNGGAEQVFGYSASEAIGRSIQMLLPEERTGEEAEILKRIQKGEKIDHFETVRVRKDGTRINISATISPVKDKNGVVVGASKIARDVTENKRAEDRIRQLNLTLESRNRQLADKTEALTTASKELERRVTERTLELAVANQVLEQSNIELKRFAYVASHDLQSPLRSIGGFVQLLKMNYQDSLEEQAIDWIDRTVQGIARMQALIQDLLDYSRVDSNQRQFVRCALPEILDQTLENLREPVLATGAQITSDELPVVLGDAGQIAQLLDNLIGNALKYHGAEPPRVHLSAELTDGQWTFTVRDNGLGIASEYQQQVFELFKRLHDNRSYPGTGIGLAVCRRIVERHGGKIWVESEPGHGSAFKFTIPSGKG
jgi:PAS domain S-box-containing protein